MIAFENCSPDKIAYDRPSEKLIKFLKKYYNLKDYIPQNNNFVIFNDYFLNHSSKKERSKTITNNNSNIDHYGNKNRGNKNI